MKRTSVLLLFLIGALSMFADILPNPIQLKSIMPNAETKVQMVSQKVTAKVYNDSSQVECIYLLKNWGQESTVEVGLPFMFFSFSSWNAYQENIHKFLEIYVGSNKVDKENLYVPQTAKDLEERIRLSKAYRDSTYTTYRVKAAQLHGNNNAAYRKAFNEMVMNFIDNNKTYDDVDPAEMITQLERKSIPFYVWKVHFKPSETVSIKINYCAPSGRTYRDSARFFTYFLSTGAAWYKNMEKADLSVILMDVDMNKVRKTRPFTVPKNEALKEFAWSFKNLEPTTDNNIYLEYVVPQKKQLTVR